MTTTDDISGATRLEAARRLDWRFLLPDPELRRVAFVGRPVGDLLPALRLHSAEVAAVEAPEVELPAASTDLVVTQEPTDRTLQQAACLLSPGGSIYIEGRGLGAGVRQLSAAGDWRPRTRRVRGLIRILEREGFCAITAHWHWPDFESCKRIVPLGRSGALDYVLGRSGRGARRAIVRAAGAWLDRAGRLGDLVPCFSITARRAPVQGPADTGPLWLTRRRADDGAGPPSCLLLTPRFRNSAHVVMLLFEPGAAEPSVVAKLPRLPSPDGGDPTLEREGAVLRAIHGSRSDGLASIPAVIELEQVAGRTVLLETAVSGRPLDRTAVRRDPQGSCRAGLEWLVKVQSASAQPAALDPDWYGRLVAEPLEWFGRVVPWTPAELRWLDRTRSLGESLRGLDLPLVIEHGDLSHPNLLLDRHGALGVVDWELGEPRGLPACDLYFFLAYLAVARCRADSVGAASRAFDAAFCDPADGWARDVMAEYAARLSLPDACLTPLFVLGWARWLVRLLQRLGVPRDAAAPIDEGLAAWLRSVRIFAFWRQAVEHVEHGRG